MTKYSAPNFFILFSYRHVDDNVKKDAHKVMKTSNDFKEMFQCPPNLAKVEHAAREALEAEKSITWLAQRDELVTTEEALQCSAQKKIVCTELKDIKATVSIKYTLCNVFELEL